jgi:membrane protein DedA with SNARE-associated domain
MVKVIFVFLGFFGGRVWTVESKRECISQILTVWGVGGGIGIILRKKNNKIKSKFGFFLCNIF